MVVPAELGGMGLDAVSTIVILEEMAAADAGYAVTWHVNNVSLTMARCLPLIGWSKTCLIWSNPKLSASTLDS
jgi:alkylation response protein AidB-like acyl-CoA dehydrogenase